MGYLMPIIADLLVVTCTSDADGSGFISKDEVMAVVGAFIQLADPAYQNLPMRDRLKSIVEGLFRAFDSNGNGIIESFELNEIVSDVITGIANILTTLIDYMEPHFLKVISPSRPRSFQCCTAHIKPQVAALSPSAMS